MVSRSLDQSPTVTLDRLRRLLPRTESVAPSALPPDTRNTSLNSHLPHVCRLSIRNDVFSFMSQYQNTFCVGGKGHKTNSNWLKPRQEKRVKKKKGNLLAHKIEKFRASARLIQPGSEALTISSEFHFLPSQFCLLQCGLGAIWWLLAIAGSLQSCCQ